MKERIKLFLDRNSRIRRVVGFVLIVLGLLAFVTPLTPGSWLVFVGLELAGLRIIGLETIRKWWTGYWRR